MPTQSRRFVCVSGCLLVPKWIGVTEPNTFQVGNSNVFENKYGKVGIGTQMPTSRGAKPGPTFVEAVES